MRRQHAAPAVIATSLLLGSVSSVPALAKQDEPVLNNAYQQWSTQTEFAAGSFAGTTIDGGAITIDAPSGTFDYTDPFGDGSTVTYDVATWTSPEIDPGFDYTQLIASWNARTPEGTWIQIGVSGLADDGTESKEYILGRWADDESTIHRTSVPSQGDGLNFVAIDTLISYDGRSMQTWKLTVSLFRKSGSTASPSISLIGAVASDLPEKLKAAKEPSPLGGAQGIELAVPTYSQETHIGHYPEFNGGGEAWCSPTSTAMILGYWQQTHGEQYGPSPADYAWVDTTDDDPYVDHSAARTYDWNYDGTGNWPYNTAYAGTFGLESFVTRLRDLNEAEQFIRAGIPLVVSLSFKKNELTGAGYGTNGHLLTIIGFTEDGDVIVNDPASHLIPSNDEVRVVYDRLEFENVWVPHSGGVAYVIRPGDVQLPSAPDQANW